MGRLNQVDRWLVAAIIGTLIFGWYWISMRESSPSVSDQPVMSARLADKADCVRTLSGSPLDSTAEVVDCADTHNWEVIATGVNSQCESYIADYVADSWKMPDSAQLKGFTMTLDGQSQQYCAIYTTTFTTGSVYEPSTGLNDDQRRYLRALGPLEDQLTQLERSGYVHTAAGATRSGDAMTVAISAALTQWDEPWIAAATDAAKAVHTYLTGQLSAWYAVKAARGDTAATAAYATAYSGLRLAPLVALRKVLGLATTPPLYVRSRFSPYDTPLTN